MRIVVTFAVPPEFAHWRRAARFERIRNAGMPAFRVERGGNEIYCVITGIGMPDRQHELGQLFETADVCIASGLIGALKKEIRAGSILVCKAAKAESTTVVMDSSRDLVNIAIHCGAEAVNSFYMANNVVTSALEKRRLARLADAVDMETFAIMRQAHLAGIPAVAIRAVSDVAANDLPVNFQRVINAQGQMNWFALVRELFKTPSRLPSFISFGIDSVRAAKTLAGFLDHYVSLIGSERGAGRSLQLMVKS